MKLATYLDANDLTLAEFGERIGVSFQAVARYAAGERIPRRDVMLRIASVTKGLVQPNDFFSTKMAA